MDIAKLVKVRLACAVLPGRRSKMRVPPRPGRGVSNILLESGGAILLENGGAILLETGIRQLNIK